MFGCLIFFTAILSILSTGGRRNPFQPCVLPACAQFYFFLSALCRMRHIPGLWFVRVFLPSTQVSHHQLRGHCTAKYSSEERGISEVCRKRRMSFRLRLWAGCAAGTLTFEPFFLFGQHSLSLKERDGYVASLYIQKNKQQNGDHRKRPPTTQHNTYTVHL